MKSEEATVRQGGGFYLPATGSDIRPAATHLLNGTNDLVIIPNSERLTNLSSHEIKLLISLAPTVPLYTMLDVISKILVSCTSD